MKDARDLILGRSLIRFFIVLSSLQIGLISSDFGQSCDGELGAVVLRQTFGIGNYKPLPAGQISYQYVENPCPNDGEYTTVDSISGTCYDSAWHRVRADHTGDEHGAMLLVNASYGQDEEFYKYTLAELCPGSTYEFSFWIMNLFNPLSKKECASQDVRDPIALMRAEALDGTIIQTSETGVVPRTNTPTWVRYSMLLVIPQEKTTIVFRLINRGRGGCGNDLALDDIQVRLCQPSVQIQFANGQIKNNICGDTNVELTSHLSTDNANTIYQWQQSADSLTWYDIKNAINRTYTFNANFTEKRLYRLVCRIPSYSTCQSNIVQSNSITIKPNSVLPFSLPPDTTLCQGRSLLVSLPPLQIPGAYYVWSDGNGDSKKTINEAGTYWLESNNAGCIYRDSIIVQITRCASPIFYVPTAFSPNYDGINDWLDMYVSQPVTFNLRIVDRWGNVLFLSNSLSNRWNGDYLGINCSAGTYAWVVEYEVPGSANQSEKITQHGQILLIR